MDESTLEDLALAINWASMAHADQTDKSGRMYFNHPLRVMRRVAPSGIEAMILGVMHDTVEDTDVELAQVYDTFGVHIGDGLDLLTHRQNEPYVEYIGRIATSGHLHAQIVKIADLADNSAPWRIIPDRERQKVLLERYSWARQEIFRQWQPDAATLANLAVQP